MVKSRLLPEVEQGMYSRNNGRLPVLHKWTTSNPNWPATISDLDVHTALSLRDGVLPLLSTTLPTPTKWCRKFLPLEGRRLGTTRRSKMELQ